MSRNKFHEKLIDMVGRLSKYRTVVLSLAIVVVFVTTYLLILPAFTLEKEKAAEQGGIDLPVTETATEISDGEETITDEEIESTNDSDQPDNASDNSVNDTQDVDESAETETTKAETNVEDTDIDESADPLKFESDNCNISVIDKDSVLPDGTRINVEEIDSEENAKEYKTYYSEALNAIRDTEEGQKVRTLEFARFYNISLTSEDEEIEPQDGDTVNVRIEYEKDSRQDLSVEDINNVRIVHFTEDEETGELKAEVLDKDENNVSVDTDRKDQLQSAEFDAGSFSVYAVVYTVDFYWTVDGKDYEFSISGGDCIDISLLAQNLGIIGKDDSNGVEAAAFASDIESVEFSNPELVWVGKADEDTTVGELKEANDLECEYSAELTEDEIAEINAKTVAAGSWNLISLKPFDTEETLTVTMKNGDQLVVKVTDAIYDVNVVNVSNLNRATGAIVRTENITNAVQGVALNSNHLQAVSVNINSSTNQITTADGVQLTEWTFERDPFTGRYTVHCSNGFLNLGNGSAYISSTPQYLEIQTNNNNQIRIKRDDNNYALNNDSNVTANGYSSYNGSGQGYHNPGEWFTVYRLSEPEVNHVKIHYVDRNGNPLTGVKYTGGNSDVVKNEDGTFTIPYNISSDVDLRANFNFEKVAKEGADFSEYTYANTHLDGKDAEGSSLKQNGYLIDSVLTHTGSDLQFKSDSGTTNPFSTNPPPGNLKYGGLTSFNLSGNVLARPTVDGDRITYATSGDKDIYVILDPVPGPSASSPSGGGQIDADPPTLKKTMTPNNDGTYTLSLKVDAHAKAASETNKANILFVVDTSSSMRAKTQNNKTRIIDTHDAVLDFGEKLLDYNTSHPESVEVSMLTFDGGVKERLDWTTSKSDFQATVNEYLRYYYLHTGTDWEDSMDEALKKLLTDTDDDPTFVVFFTDGEPSQYTSFHGAGENTNTDVPDPITGGTAHEPVSGGYSDFFSYFLSREGSKDEMRAVVDAGAQLYGIYAYNTTNEHYDSYNGEEDGAKMLHNAIKYGYNTDQDLTNNLFYEAKNTNDLKGAFDKIFNLITEKVGFTNVVVSDGITAGVTSSTVIDGDVSGFTYTIKDKSGAVAYKVTVAPNGAPEGTADGKPVFWIGGSGPPVVGDIRSVTTTKIKTDGDGNPITDSSGNIQTEDVNVDVYYYKDAENKEYIMPISTTGNMVTWDLSPLGILKDGYSYQVDFVVWPNQDAYDLVADLNNGKRPDIEATANWEAQPIKTDSSGKQYRQGGIPAYPYISRYEETGVYAAMSNTEQSVDYYKADNKIKNGEEVTVYTGPFNKPVDPPDPMPLKASAAQIVKQWNVDRDPAILAQYLYEEDGRSKEFKVDFDVFQGTNTTPYTNFSLGWDSTAGEDGRGAYVWDPEGPMATAYYAGKTYTIGTSWKEDFAVATGLMLTEARMNELGLNKSSYPKANFDGQTYYILETGHDYTIKEHTTGTIGYEFDFDPPVYHPMLVDGVLKSVNLTKTGETITIDKIDPIEVDENGKPSMQIENTLRGYIHMDKVVVGPDGETVVDTDETKFTYRIELNNSNEPGPFTVAGSHVPWYGINGLFYHDSSYNYYQIEVVGEGDSGYWAIKNEQGSIYRVTSTGFDPDNTGAQTVTYLDTSDGEPGVSKQVTVTGNQMTHVSDNDVTATLKMRQGETLNIANVPVGTEYKLTEVNERGYELIRIDKEIKLNAESSQAESSETFTGDDLNTVPPDVAGSITGTIVENRDNHVIFTNKAATGELKLQKEVTINGFDPSNEAVVDKTLADGVYEINLTGKEGTDTEGASYTVKITITNGAAASATVRDNTAETPADVPVTLTDGAVLLEGLTPGVYTVTEQTDTDTLCIAINSTNTADGDPDLENRTIEVNVKPGTSNVSLISFINNHADNGTTDIAHVSVRKTFVGLTSNQIPANFKVNVKVTYEVTENGHLVTKTKEYTLTGASDTPNGVVWNQTTDTDGNIVWNWAISIQGLNPDAQVEVEEVNYGKAGYDVETSVNPGNEGEGASTTSYTGTVSPSTTVSSIAEVQTEQNTLVFPVEDKGTEQTVFIARIIPSQTSLVISKNKLNLSERAALEEELHHMPNAQDWYNGTTPLYYSFEEAANNKIVVRNSSHVTYYEENGKGYIRFDKKAQWNMVALRKIIYVEGRPADFNFRNSYTEKDIDIDIIKEDNGQRTIKLPGAKFMLTQLDESTTPGRIVYKTKTEGGEEVLARQEESVATGADGKISFESLTRGYYEIKETQLPDGYVIEGSDSFYIKVADGTATYLIVSDNESKTIDQWASATTSPDNLVQVVAGQADDPSTPDDETVNTAIHVGNVSGAELPQAGGIGTTIFYIFGSILVIAGGIYFAARRRIIER